MPEDKILGQIAKEVRDYENAILPENPSFAPTIPEVINLINCQANSRFLNGDFDENNQRKTYFNINQEPTWIGAKEVDLDVKDVGMHSTGWRSYYPTWFLKAELKGLFKDQPWGKFFNECGFSFSKYGHIVVKKRDGDVPSLMDLRNLFVSVGADDINHANSIIERHSYTPEEYQRLWGNDKILAEAWAKGKYITVLERHGLVPREWITKRKKGYVLTRAIVATTADGRPSKVLDDKEVFELPYKEVGAEKVAGRWLRRGTVEKLFENQIMVNLLANYKRAAMAWGAKQVFQTTDKNIEGNLVNDIVNGTIIKARAKIERIETEERNLGAYLSEENRWDGNTRKRTFSHEVVSGERLPSGTRLGTVAIQAQKANGYFDLLRENFGLFVKEIITDWVLPSLKKKKSLSHTLKFIGSGDDIEQLDNLVIGQRVNEEMRAYIKSNGFLPPSGLYGMMKDSISAKVKSPKDRYTEIPSGLYDNIQYLVDVVITGESVNVDMKVNALKTFSDLFAVQPQLLQNPVMKSIISEMMDLVGLDPTRLDVQGDMPALPQGGSIAKSAPTGPAVNNTQTTL